MFILWQRASATLYRFFFKFFLLTNESLKYPNIFKSVSIKNKLITIILKFLMNDNII